MCFVYLIYLWAAWRFKGIQCLTVVQLMGEDWNITLCFDAKKAAEKNQIHITLINLIRQNKQKHLC